MKNKIFAYFFALVLCAAAFAQAGPLSTSRDPQPEVVWKIATLAPKGIGWSELFLELFIEPWNELTSGRIGIKVYWGGVMGDDARVLQKLHRRELNGAGISGAGVILAIPEMAVLQLPFLFNNYEEVDFIREKMQPVFDKLAEKNGFVLSGWIDQDFDKTFSTVSPLSEIKQWQEAKWICAYGELEEMTFDAMGARCTYLSPEDSPNALRTGEINAGIGPPIWIIGTQLHNRIRYLQTNNIRYSPGLMLQYLQDFKEMEDGERFKQAVLDLRKNLVPVYCQQIRRTNARFLAALRNYGIAEVEMHPSDLAVLKRRTRIVYDELADKLYPRELLEEILALLEVFREQNKNRNNPS